MSLTSLVFPTSQEMMIQNLPSFTGGMWTAPTKLCKALKKIDDKELQIQSSELPSEKIAKEYEKNYLGWEKTTIFLRRTAFAAPIVILAAPLGGTIAAISSFVVPYLSAAACYPSMNYLNCRIKGSKIGVDRINRLQEKIYEIFSENLKSVGNEKMQLYQAEKEMIALHKHFYQAMEKQTPTVRLGHATYTFRENGFSEYVDYMTEPFTSVRSGYQKTAAGRNYVWEQIPTSPSKHVEYSTEHKYKDVK